MKLKFALSAAFLATGIISAFADASGFTRLKYVDSHGTEYFDTGLKFTDEMAVEIKYRLLSIPSTPTGVFGVRADGSSKNVSIGANYNVSHADFNNGSVDTYRCFANTSTETIYHVRNSATQRLFIDARTGGTAGNSDNRWSGSFETDGNAYVFAVNGTAWPKASARF